MIPSSAVQSRGGMECFCHRERGIYKTRISSLSHVILNPLLQQIQPSLSGLYAGEFAHANIYQSSDLQQRVYGVANQSSSILHLGKCTEPKSLEVLGNCHVAS